MWKPVLSAANHVRIFFMPPKRPRPVRHLAASEAVEASLDRLQRVRRREQLLDLALCQVESQKAESTIDHR